jgi:hypothetical protein
MIKTGDLVRAINFDGRYVHGIVIETSVPDYRFSTILWVGGGLGTIFTTALEVISGEG